MNDSSKILCPFILKLTNNQRKHIFIFEECSKISFLLQNLSVIKYLFQAQDHSVAVEPDPQPRPASDLTKVVGVLTPTNSRDLVRIPISYPKSPQT